MVALVEVDRLDAHRGAPHRPDLLLVEADGHARARRDDDLPLAVGDRGAEQAVALLDAHADDALLAEVLVLGDVGLLDEAVARERHDVGALLHLADGRDGGDLLAGLHADEVDDGATLGVAGRLRDLVDLLDVDLAAVAEEEDVRVRRGDEELVDEVLLAGLHADLAAPAAPLRAVDRRGRALDVAGVRDRDDHVLFLDEVLHADLGLVGDDLGAARLGVLRAALLELAHDDVPEQLLVAEDGREVRDAIAQLAVLARELVLLEPGEARQAHLEDGLGLTLGERVGRARQRVGDLALGAARPADEGLEPGEREPHEVGARRLGVGGGADGGDDEIGLGRGHSEAEDDLARGLGLAKLEARAARDDLAPVLDEHEDGAAEIEHLGAPLDDREVDDAERRLHVRQAVQVVLYELREDVLLELDDEPHAVAVALVADLGDAVDALVAHQLRDLGVQARLVDLVRDLGDDDLLAVAAPLRLLDLAARAHDDAAASGAVGLLDAGVAVDDAARREVGPRHEAQQLVDREVGVSHQRDGRVDDLGEVVRRDVRGHAHGDAARAVDEQQRKARRQDDRLVLALVEVGGEVDGVLLEVREQIAGDAREARLGVAVGGRRVAVDGAEVSLAVDEHVPEREVLRHAHEGVVDGRVAVRVVLRDDVADDARALLVRPARVDLLLVHREEDAPVHRLQAVARVGDRAPHDDAHGVIEVGRAHLVLQADRLQGDVRGLFGHRDSGGRAWGRAGLLQGSAERRG